MGKMNLKEFLANQQDVFGYSWNSKDYAEVNKLETVRSYEFESLLPEEQLNLIQNEIKIRVKITQNEVFKIGQLLCLAKPICHKQGIGFQEWIETHFDFSYETAKNFINVYEQCMGIQELAEKVPKSILYRIASKSVPAELRNWMIVEGNLEKLSMNKYQKLVKLYNEGGMEAVDKTRGEIQKGIYQIQQIQFALQDFKLAQSTIEGLSKRFKSKFDIDSSSSLLSRLSEETQQIVTNMTDILTRISEELERGCYDAQILLDKFQEATEEKL